MIPFIPASVPVVQGPEPRPPEPDPSAYPKRSVCEHCGYVIEQAADGAAWTVGNGTECDKAPNPDEGPMPGHEPGTILHPPRR